MHLNITRGKTDVLMWSIDNLLQALKKELANHERHEETKRSGKGKRELKTKKYCRFEESTASALVAKKSQQECAFCLKNHPSETCRKFTEVEARKQIFRKFGRCWNCSRKGHRSRECKSKTLGHCGGRHHPSICEAKTMERRWKRRRSKLVACVSSKTI